MLGSDRVMKKPPPALLLAAFVMDGCPYCTPLVGQGKVLSRLGETTQVFEIGTEDSLTRTCAVRSFPTLLFVTEDHGVLEWRGPRDASNLAEACRLLRSRRLRLPASDAA